jgi:hypothetical protein
MQSIAQRRRSDRDRKRRQRAAARAAGVPSSAAALNAIAEGVAFLATSRVNIERARSGLTPQVDLALVFTTAVQILTARHGCDKHHSEVAIKRLLAPRPEHRWPSHVPTHAVTATPAGEAA